jgi:hypothetical protein
MNSSSSAIKTLQEVPTFRIIRSKLVSVLARKPIVRTVFPLFCVLAGDYVPYELQEGAEAVITQVYDDVLAMTFDAPQPALEQLGNTVLLMPFDTDDILEHIQLRWEPYTCRRSSRSPLCVCHRASTSESTNLSVSYPGWG